MSSKKTDRLGDRSATQIDKFREAARGLETDDREEAFDALVKRIAKTPSSKSRSDKDENDG